MNNERSRVYIVDDHPLVREWLAALIDQQADLEVCGEADDIPNARSGIAASKPDVAIIDLSLKSGSGIELIKHVQADAPQTQIVVLSMHDEKLYAERVLRAGARAYIMKRETAKCVVTGIRKVLRGDIYLSDQMTEAFAARFAEGRPPAGGSLVEQLSDRELQVFQMLGQGIETREVANTLGLSIKSVQAYCARIKAKLRLANAAELLREAVRWNEERTRYAGQ